MSTYKQIKIKNKGQASETISIAAQASKSIDITFETDNSKISFSLSKTETLDLIVAIQDVYSRTHFPEQFS